MRRELALTGGIPVRRRAFPQWPQPAPAVESAVRAVIGSGHWWQSGGGVSERLEDALEKWFGVQRAVCVMNGTVAIEVALRALDIGAGDEVLVPATTFVSTAAAVAAVGAMPVPVDVDPSTYNVDLEIAQRLCTQRTRALIAVHLAGQPVNLAGARRLCDARSLALIEDSAQAIGGAWDGARVASAGDVITLSFQAGKLLPGGEGGAVLLRTDAGLARRVEMIANCGRPRGSSRYDHSELGTNARVSELNAAVALAHLPGYEELWQRRDGTARRVRELVDADSLVGVDARVTRHDLYMLLLRTPERLVERGVINRSVVAALNAEGITCQVLYPTWSTLPAFSSLVDERARWCSVSHEATDRGLWLHHRLLLDKQFPDDLQEAWKRILAAPDELIAWQREHVVA